MDRELEELDEAQNAARDTEIDKVINTIAPDLTWEARTTGWVRVETKLRTKLIALHSKGFLHGMRMSDECR